VEAIGNQQSTHFGEKIMSADFEVIYSGTDRVEWLKIRREGIGASEAPAILGESTYASPVSVFAEKLNTDEPEDNDSERMAWGRKLEPIIVAEFGVRTDRRVQHISEKMLLRSTRWPFMQCTLDGKQWPEIFDVADQAMDPWFPIEAKNSTDSDLWGDGIPRITWVQVQHQLAVTGKPWGSVGILLWGCEFKWCDVPRNDEFIEEILVPRCQEFWDLVQSGGPPPPVDGHKETAKALAKIFPQTSDETVTLPGEFTDLSSQLQTMKKSEKDTKTIRAEVENKIRLAIGEAAYGLLPNGDSYSWKANKNGARTLRFKRGAQT
jgi:putative phage-type endonuclease